MRGVGRKPVEAPPMNSGPELFIALGGRPAVAMIVEIETMLADESSAAPVSPCPEVQPPTVRAPTPISRPAPNRRATSLPSEGWASSQE